MGLRVESYLRDHGVSSLDLVVATHPHEDHIGGLIKVLNDFPVSRWDIMGAVPLQARLS